MRLIILNAALLWMCLWSAGCQLCAPHSRFGDPYRACVDCEDFYDFPPTPHAHRKHRHQRELKQFYKELNRHPRRHHGALGGGCPCCQSGEMFYGDACSGEMCEISMGCGCDEPYGYADGMLGGTVVSGGTFEFGGGTCPHCQHKNETTTLPQADPYQHYHPQPTPNSIPASPSSPPEVPPAETTSIWGAPGHQHMVVPPLGPTHVRGVQPVLYAP